MADTRIFTHGATLAVKTGTGTTYTAVGGFNEAQAPSREVTTQEVWDHNTPLGAKGKAVKDVTWSDMTVNVDQILTDPGQVIMETAHSTLAVIDIEFTPSGNKTVQFSGIITKAKTSPDSKENNTRTIEYTIELCTGVTIKAV